MGRRANTAGPISQRRGRSKNLRPTHGASATKRTTRSQAAGTTSGTSRQSKRRIGVVQTINEDDLCPVCQQLLYQPVVTSCRHHLCQSCMAKWADISTSSQMIILDIDELPTQIESGMAADLEVNCPMCRRQTIGTLDHARARQLAAMYPEEYAARQKEDDAEAVAAKFGVAASVITMTVYIGNRNEPVESSSPSSTLHKNQHDCIFFVKPSRTDIIEEVQIQVPENFRPSRIMRTRSPYEVRRTVEYSFPIFADIILKAGYSWLSPDAQDSTDGARKGTLPIEWQIDLNRHEGKGSVGRLRLKVMQEGGKVAATGGGDDDANHLEAGGADRELRRDQSAWERAVREYHRDGLWSPSESDDG